MNLLEDLFAEYVNMRGSGMATNDVLNVLRSYIEPLTKHQKQELADFIHNWEHTHTKHKPSTGSTPTVRSLKRDTTGAAAPPEEGSGWVTCYNCGKKNRHDSVFCFSCGHLLEQGDNRFSTKRFSDKLAPESHYYSRDSVLILKVRDADRDFEMRPQFSLSELVIGRSAANSAMLPDIDLASCDAEQMGVSRLHLAVKYEDEAIKVYDLGSANGSFINGQKLHPREIRVLRDGDELRLGHMIMRVIYYHPGEEIHS